MREKKRNFTLLLIASLNLHDKQNDDQNMIHLLSERKEGYDAGPDLGGQISECEGLHCFLLLTERNIRELPSAVLELQ